MPRPTLIWTMLACLAQAGAMQSYSQASFRRTIGTQPFPQQFAQVMRQADGSITGAGYYTTNVFINYPLLSSITPQGTQRWTLRFGPGSSPRAQLGEVTALAHTQSGDILAAGFINTDKNADIQYPYEDAFVARVSPNGDVQWLFTYNRNKGSCIRENLFRPAHIAEMPGGDIIVAADMQDCNEQAQYLVLLRLDANGGVTWTSTYQYPLGLSVRSGMTVDGRGITCWAGRVLPGPGNRYVLEQLRFDPASGNLMAQKSWEIDPQQSDPAMTIGGQLLRSRQLSNGHTLLLGSTRSAFQPDAGTSPVFSVLEFDARDQFVRGYHISPSTADAGTLMLNITADENGLVLFNRMFKRTATRHSMALATMQDGQFVHQRRLDDIRAYLANPEPLEILQDQSLILLNAYDRVIDFYRLHQDDRDTGCLGSTVPAQDLFRVSSVTYRPVQAPPLQAFADTIFAVNDGFYMEKDEAAPEGNRLELGPGLILCPGRTVIIKAPDGFSAYQWSNGQSGQEITVGQPGQYACRVIDVCGLSYTDSVQVSDASSVPLVVQSSKTICPGGEVRFEALPGFSEYRWSPSYRMVSNPGGAVMVANPLRDTSYVVQARHPNGCVLLDTVRVFIDDVPAVSLGPDQNICAGDSILLELPAGTGNHRWDNGASATARWVNKSGRYTVTVYSDNGCPATDTLDVRYKDCGSGFFMPNAFTPNHDGLNDAIRPVIGVVPVRYRFAVYNRWGQEVFSTSDPMQAWDGRLKGIAQQAQVFGWVCTWQVEGGPVQKRAGSLVLIR